MLAGGVLGRGFVGAAVTPVDSSDGDLMKTFIIALAWLIAAGCNRPEARKEPPAADNTKVNERDHGDSVTPPDQNENKQDVEITAEVRKELMSNHDLSTTAQNVKIVTQNGVVTLRGPVESASEKQTVHAVAQKAPGTQRVDDQLEIKSK